jgi:hypothetical protein
MPEEILSKELIKQIASAISSDEMSVPEWEASLATASAEKQRAIKRAWKLKLRADRLVEAEKRAKNSTKTKERIEGRRDNQE